MAIENPTARVAPFLDDVFRFKIGDQVVLKQQLHRMRFENEINLPVRQDRYSGRIGSPVPMTVCSRWVEQCYGGVQMHVTVRMFDSKDGVATQTRFSEYELAPYEEALQVARDAIEVAEEPSEESDEGKG